MRKKIIAGNWKMNKTNSDAAKFISENFLNINLSDNVELVFCVPYPALCRVNNALKMAQSKIYVGAQNMHWQDNGAYTGEISADMLLDVGVKYVILGHSERREYFLETNEIINKKAKKALEKGLTPIVCVGESLEIREKGEAIEFVRSQIQEVFNGITADDAKKIVVAYEPIWAIGTGKTASKEQAEEICKDIREQLSKLYSDNISQEIIIQYGGSVTPDNAKELFSMPNIDGALVGGASLKPDFIKIIEAC